MEVMEILAFVFGGSGMLTGLVSLIKARSTVKNEEMERLSKAMEGMEKRCNELDSDFTEYKKNAEQMIQEGRQRMQLLDRRNSIMTKALNSAWRCNKVNTPEECIALYTLKGLCDKNQGVCEVNI